MSYISLGPHSRCIGDRDEGKTVEKVPTLDTRSEEKRKKDGKRKGNRKEQRRV